MIVTCPGCAAAYDVEEHPVGTRGRCRCGIVFRIDPPPPHTRGATPSERACPRCSALMWTRRIAEVVIDDCGCGGSYIDRGSLDRIVSDRDDARAAALRARYAAGGGGGADAGAELPGPTGAVYVKCPDCRAVMNRQRFLRNPSLLVDVCRDHGTWFDAHKLARALADIDAGGHQRNQRAALDEKHAADAAIEQQRRNAQERERQFHTRQARADANTKAASLLRGLGKVIR